MSASLLSLSGDDCPAVVGAVLKILLNAILFLMIGIPTKTGSRNFVVPLQ